MPTTRTGKVVQFVVGVLVDAYLWVGDRVDAHLIRKYQP